ncbi:hypothetical protein KUTeg_018664 [Tegillarca granosa]|uniref:CCHC-type domain-containing protein n=1 Tax=Tegillarca granosa TaxID=220873 RepID=A0ABQ9EEH1_TEGGR|nr:hypothetical protein KUTeg_018664 [Tegillarca granosa]
MDINGQAASRSLQQRKCDNGKTISKLFPNDVYGMFTMCKQLTSSSRVFHKIMNPPRGSGISCTRSTTCNQPCRNDPEGQPNDTTFITLSNLTIGKLWHLWVAIHANVKFPEIGENLPVHTEKILMRDTEYEFNEENFSNISKIKRAVKSCDYDRVLELCDIIEHKVYKRNKCIKLAEKSPAGWDTVKEYLSDELAPDSEDEKKMRSEEFRALRKRRQNKRSRKDTKPREDNSNRTPSATAPNPDSVLNSNFRSFRGQRTTTNPTDYCFACNQQGHWRKNCPFTNKTTHFRAESATLPRN